MASVCCFAVPVCSSSTSAGKAPSWAILAPRLPSEANFASTRTPTSFWVSLSVRIIPTRRGIAPF
ncbi:hypothetical protein PF005_g26525 [Phytophthora fragariae]|uniref:Uncharacterized protein n=2 Tax=Phytophthora TaxID=4783 RepID=A0A6A3I5Q0_9STRA|nr:hypothetical protein PF003_g1815 [Phytophthora fragariae]KAE8969222.1 hypothetical protein PR001_g27564 [Phytophthora rubi]KAE8931076.1 hypothetical protein PF009_g18851 [Phytophthora fragariae]KAE8975383.1 hypothetical protein PF011_g24494 [Phytophthora fragariae]KAE9072053.1 hypothetical protein PF010_g25639 [Phytophthora fragariae]